MCSSAIHTPHQQHITWFKKKMMCKTKLHCHVVAAEKQVMKKNASAHPHLVKYLCDNVDDSTPGNY